MAEIINYKNTTLGLGTEFNLWHVSYPKLKLAFDTGLLKESSHANLPPHKYLEPNSVFRFRFDFHDEAGRPLESPSDDCFRSIVVLMDNGVGTKDKIFISQQKCILPEGEDLAYLAILYTKQDDTTYVATEVEEARTIVRQIIRNHVIKETDSNKKQFYRNFVVDILKGYRKNIRVELARKVHVEIKKDLAKKRGYRPG